MCKIKLQLSIAFLYINNSQLQNRTEKNTPVTIDTKTINFLDINLMRYASPLWEMIKQHYM